MAEATEKQLVALRRFAKNEDMKELFEGVVIDSLEKKAASDLMDRCIAKINGKKGGGSSGGQYRKNGRLSDEELEKVRESHRQHCRDIINECMDDYPEDTELQLAVFNKRCDKVFTWILRAVEEKATKQTG
jgi:hypothetical protein